MVEGTPAPGLAGRAFTQAQGRSISPNGPVPRGTPGLGSCQSLYVRADLAAYLEWVMARQREPEGLPLRGAA